MCEHCQKPLADEPIVRSWIGPPMTDNSAGGGPTQTLTFAPSDLRWDTAIAHAAQRAIRGWHRP